MSVIVDTPVWSELLRRSAPNEEVVESLRQLIREGDALLLGAIRQELLSGVKDANQFKKLQFALRAFPDISMETEDFELAASYFNICRGAGVQGSNTDFLICAVSVRLAVPILTLDKDFHEFAKHLPIKLA